MLFREVTYNYSEDRSKSTNALCGRKEGLRLRRMVYMLLPLCLEGFELLVV
jgi:hypothetical protein